MGKSSYRGSYIREWRVWRKAINSTGQAMGVKEMMVLILVGFCYILQFDIAKGGCKEACKGEMVSHKHFVKTVQNAHGDIFDCVDINKQPAFDHPALKNHVLQMRPTSVPEGASEVLSKSPTSQISFLNENCPIGTIPIMRRNGNFREVISKFDGSRTMNLQQKNVAVNDSTHVSYFAHIRMKKGYYYGTAADLTVYGVPQVSANQFSSSAIWFIGDGDGSIHTDINYIIVGWMVHPSLYGDNKTRLFTRWSGGGPQNTGCYDLLCPGFVQVNPQLPLGAILEPLSEYDGTQNLFRIHVFKDIQTGDWWLAVGQDFKAVGYWPRSLFNTLADHAKEVFWGGDVLAAANENSPPMGSGHFPKEGRGRVCAFHQLLLIDRENKYVRVPKDRIIYYSPEPYCYHTGLLMDMEHGTTGFLFGGPGNCSHGME